MALTNAFFKLRSLT